MYLYQDEMIFWVGQLGANCMVLLHTLLLHMYKSNLLKIAYPCVCVQFSDRHFVVEKQGEQVFFTSRWISKFAPFSCPKFHMWTKPHRNVTICIFHLVDKHWVRNRTWLFFLESRMLVSPLLLAFIVINDYDPWVVSKLPKGTVWTLIMRDVW